MNSRIIAFLLTACAIVALSTPRPAEARAVIPELLQDVTRVVVTPNVEEFPSFELCGLTITYRLLMAVPGVGAVWVFTELVYSTGPQGGPSRLDVRRWGHDLWNL